MSLTVALNISFREDSKKSFRSLDLAMLDRAVAAVDNSPDGLYTVESIRKKVGVWLCDSAAVCGRNKSRRQSHESDGEEKLVLFCLQVCSAPAGVEGSR